MDWLRYYHSTPTDPKWRAIAIEAEVPVHAVLAVWDCMLVNASEAEPRGTLNGWNHRVIGAAIDLKGAQVEAIYQAMQGLVLDGDRLMGWEKRQRASDDVSHRVKQHRDKKKQEGNVTNGECNVTATEIPLRATDTDTDSERDNTPPPITAPAPDAPAPAAGGRVASQGRPWLIYIQAASDGFRDAGYERANPAGDDATYAQQLLAEGFDPEIVRWTVETVTRDVMAKDPSRRPPNSLKYMIDAIRRNRAKPPPDMPVPANREGDLRRAQLERFIERGVWLDQWGPKPTIEQAQAELSGAKVAA